MCPDGKKVVIVNHIVAANVAALNKRHAPFRNSDIQLLRLKIIGLGLGQRVIPAAL